MGAGVRVGWGGGGGGGGGGGQIGISVDMIRSREYSTPSLQGFISNHPYI